MKTTYERNKHVQQGRRIKKSIGEERETLNIIATAIEERQNDPSRQCTCKKGYDECPACLAWKAKGE